MYKKLKISILFFLILFCLSSCSPKVGCPAQENLKASVTRKGEIKNTGRKSALFSPREMRRMGKG
jgi:hypothetical protein